MIIKTIAVCLLMLASVGVAYGQSSERTFRYEVALDVDTSGRVGKVTLPEDVPAPFAAPLEKAAGGWVFKARMRNGHAVTARTYARVELLLAPQGKDRFAMQFELLSNGPSLQFTTNPVYPPDMMRVRSEGTVYMAAVVQPDGRVTDIRLKDAKLVQHSIVRTQHAKDAFAKSAREAMQTMQAKPEWIDGKPVATAIVLPVSFGLMGASGGDANASGSAVGR